MKTSFLIAALLLISSAAFAGKDRIYVIAGTGATLEEAKKDALDIATGYCKKKHDKRAVPVDWAIHPQSSDELRSIILDYTCGKTEKQK